jgi:hypothetical protein
MTYRLSVILLTLLSGCANVPSSQQKTDVTKHSIQSAKWLLGTWVSETKRGASYETWKQQDDTTFLATSFVVTNRDTIVAEHIKLVKDGDDVLYIPLVPDQNKGLPVTFKLIFMDSVKFIFENPQHDFPQTIFYHHTSPDSLMAEISGTIKGEYQVQQFRMARIR